MDITSKACFLAGAVLLGGTSVKAAPIGSAYFFGDSFTDCCVFGRFTNSNAPNWADQLAPLIGANYTASAQTNLAIGGAQSGYDNVVPAFQAAYGAQTGFYGAQTGLLAQISRFGTEAISVGPNDIAGIWIGTNDIWPSSYAATDVAPAGLNPINRPLGIQPSVAALTGYIIGNIRSAISTLKADGFRNFVVVSPYDLGQSAVEPNAAAAALAMQYSVALRNAEASLYTPGVNTYFVDVLSLLQQVQASPGAYGFQHATSIDTCTANDCSSLSLAEQNTYVFNDYLHLTSGFDQLIANQAAATVNADRGKDSCGIFRHRHRAALSAHQATAAPCGAVH